MLKRNEKHSVLYFLDTFDDTKRPLQLLQLIKIEFSSVSL